MSDDPLDIDIDDLQRRMDGAMVSLKTEFASLRTGRASGSILDPVMVDAARKRWTQCKDAGHALTYWQQTPAGGWEKKAEA